jgi:hypothetical protein
MDCLNVEDAVVANASDQVVNGQIMDDVPNTGVRFITDAAPETLEDCPKRQSGGRI